MIECVQGEGGLIPLDPQWAKEAAKLAHEAGAIVIADEVQTGFGRTGTLLASEQLEIDADVVSLAKGIAGGVPMGACLYKGKANVFKAGDHQSTFGGNPLACAAAQVILKTVNDYKFLETVIDKGLYIRKKVESWNLPCVENVRGRGLMIGIQINKDPHDIAKECLSRGLLFSTAGKNVIRIVPALNISYKEIDLGLAILKSVLEK
jgi:acetylornithine/N-succinyldiaminopimelate aminotransferase